MNRRTFAAAFALLLLSVSGRAEARCASIEPAAEALRSRYVLEGTVESVAGDGTLALLVNAVWKGSPPRRVRVQRSQRSFSPDPHVGERWLVFASGDSDAALAMMRCGSSGPLPATATTDALTAAGLTRVAR